MNIKFRLYIYNYIPFFKDFCFTNNTTLFTNRSTHYICIGVSMNCNILHYSSTQLHIASLCYIIALQMLHFISEGIAVALDICFLAPSNKLM